MSNPALHLVQPENRPLSALPAMQILSDSALELIEERAAIFEFEAGLEREEAERQALRWYVQDYSQR